MLVPFDPFGELERLRQALSGNRDAAAGWPGSLAMDAWRADDRLLVAFDAPGLDPSSLELTVENNVLSLRAERHWAPEGQVLVRERPQGVFSRQVLLEDGLDTDHLEASYENGVLTVVIPIAEGARSRRIPVTTGTNAAIEAASSEPEAA